MSTSIGAGSRFEADRSRTNLRIWLRLFLGISGGAVAIAVTLGLVVVLASAAQAAAAERFQVGSAAIRGFVGDGDRGKVGQRILADVQGQVQAEAPVRARSDFREAPPGGLPNPSSTPAAFQLLSGVALVSLGFLLLVSASGSRLLAGGPGKARNRQSRFALVPWRF